MFGRIIASARRKPRQTPEAFDQDVEAAMILTDAFAFPDMRPVMPAAAVNDDLKRRIYDEVEASLRNAGYLG